MVSSRSASVSLTTSSTGTPVQFTLPPGLTYAERAVYFATVYATTERAVQNASSGTNTRTTIRQKEEVKEAKKTRTQSSKQRKGKKYQAPEDDEVMYVSSGSPRPAAPA